MMSTRKSIIKGGSWIGGATVILAAVHSVQLILLARLLVPAEYGVVSILMLVLSFVELLMLSGIANAIIQRSAATRNELSSLHWLNTSVGVVLGALLMLLSPVIARYFDAPESITPLMILSLAVPLNSQTHVKRACMEKTMAFREVATIELTAGLMQSAALILGAGICGVRGVAIGLVLGFGLRALLFHMIGRRYVKLRFHFRYADTTRFLSFGVYQMLNSFVGFIDGSLASLVVGRALSVASLGGYTLAYNVSVNIPGKINPIITRVMYPVLAKTGDDAGKFSRIVLLLIKTTGLLSSPLLVSLCVTAPIVVPMIFGEPWRWTSVLVQILAVAGICRAINNPIGIIIMAKDRQRLGLVINIFKTVFSLVIMLTMVSHLGVMGAAFSIVLLGFVTMATNIVLVRRLASVRWRDALSSHLIPIALCIPASAVGFGVYRLALEGLGGVSTAIVCTVLVFATYFGVARIFRVDVVIAAFRGLREKLTDGAQSFKYARK
ncbi:MOP flippase family protein [Microbacterium sp. YY-01]|uniref:MOP flippase family protein n=1 Tax=Microbacterium sp. YY-01 TaxID=3421634 RepID=UPI003D16778B